MDIEFDARRVAAAFGVEEWETQLDPDGWFFAEHGDGRFFYLSPISDPKSYITITIEGKWDGDSKPWCAVDLDASGPLIWFHGHFGDFMARGLYRLGFKDQGVLSQLPELNAHEKLELRLDFPREFWPQSWVDDSTQ